jgi:uncharacterized protein DUF397
MVCHREYSEDFNECTAIAVRAPPELRDSKNPTGSVLRVGPAAWSALVASVRS